MPSFRASIRRQGVLRVADVPAAVSRVLGGGTRLPILLRLGDDAVRTTLNPLGRGRHRIVLPLALLRPRRLDVGDWVELTLTPDTASREPALPPELERAFRFRAKAAATYAACTVAIRREIVRYIETAVKSETRARRIEDILERLAEGNIRPAGGR